MARSRLLAAALCALCFATLAGAQAPPEPAEPELSPAWFDLTINEVPKGEVLLRLGAGDVWVPVDDLQRGGVVFDGGSRIVVGDRSLVSLRSLAPGIDYVLDEEQLALRIAASQALLGRSTLDLNPRRRPERLSRLEAPTAFLNVGARADDWERASATTELGLSASAGLLLSSASWDSELGFLRGLTSAQWDDASALVRYRGGELFVSGSDPLGGSAVLLGLSAGREFSLDPYTLRDPYPRTSVFVGTPSTLEVWVGDTLVRRTQVAPGTLDVENLPLYAGVNEVRTVLRDAFGREQTASSFFLMGSNLLAPGVDDWAGAAGWVRRAEADGAVSYDEPLVAGRYRRGLSRLLTLGVRAEGSEAVANGGATLGLATPAGDVEAGAAWSQAGDRGGAGFLTWRHRITRFASLAAQVKVMSDAYATSSLEPSADRAIVRGHLGGSVSPIPGFSILAELSGWRMRDGGDGWRGSLRTSAGVGRGQQVGLSGSLAGQTDQPRAWELFATWSMQLPGAHSVEVSGRTSSGGETGWVTASRGLGMGPGYGYRAEGRVGDGSLAAVDVHGQTEFGRAALFARWLDPFSGDRSHHESVEAAAGLVLIDGELHVSRPIEGSYALLVLEGAPGVQVTLDGQPVGRTDSKGRIFIPGLLPYYGNRLAIRDSDLPLDFKVNEIERYVAPRHRGGSVEVFDVGPTRVVVGKLLLTIDEKELAPEWGEIAVELPTGRVVSPIGYGGDFWLEGLTPGRHEALVRWAGRLCRMTFEVGKGAGVVNVGTQRCTQLLAAGGDQGVPARRPSRTSN